MNVTQEEYEKKVDVVRCHDKAYYIDDAPTISDFQYDMLYKELLQIEEAHPEYITPASPSQVVGGMYPKKEKHFSCSDAK